MANKIPQLSRLAQSSYMSPYSHVHTNPDPATATAAEVDANPYAALRTSALADLEAMGFDPRTMAERGVTWAEDQDPFGHVMHSQVIISIQQLF